MEVRIAVVGAGQVGFNLARRLSRENHQIILIDHDREKGQRAQECMDIAATPGSGSSISTLVEAGVNGADMLMAVTDSDEVNVLYSITAGQHRAPTNGYRWNVNPESSHQHSRHDLVTVGD